MALDAWLLLQHVDKGKWMVLLASSSRKMLTSGLEREDLERLTDYSKFRIFHSQEGGSVPGVVTFSEDGQRISWVTFPRLVARAVVPEPVEDE